MSIRQEKYDVDFTQRLKVSQEMVAGVCDNLRANGMMVRGEDDGVPFVMPDGRKIRLCDIMAVNLATSETNYLEVKDFCRCWKYDCTGLPRRYVEGKLMLLDRGHRVFVIFRESPDWVRERSEHSRIPEYAIVDRLVEQGFAARGAGGSARFIPYGHSLSFLMGGAVDERRTHWLRTKLENYDGELQWLWNTDMTLPLDRLVKEVVLGGVAH